MSDQLAAAFIFQASEIPSVVDKLTSEGAILTVIFLAVGLYVINKLPGIIAAFKSDGNGKEKERADQVLTALLASTAATVTNTAKLDADLRENEQVRRHFHQVKNSLAAWQLLGLKLVEHLESPTGRAMTRERKMLSDAARAMTDDTPVEKDGKENLR